MLSNYHRDVVLFRFSEITGEIFILAGDNIQVIIRRQGKWDFVDET